MTGGRFTSSLAEDLAEDLLRRFLAYVQVDTTAAPESARSPSSPGQLELARQLVDELRGLGLPDAGLDANGYVSAVLPGEGARVGLLAHLDTSPDAPGAGVRPIVHRGYDGGVLELPAGGTRLDPAAMADLRTVTGHDIVTSSGDTLLGADDKAGVAIILTAVAHLLAHPELPRPALRVCFTPDEEIGRGTAHFDLEAFGADCAYTLDGSGLGELQDESFTAREAIVRVEGVEAHPGQAAGKLVNAARVAARIAAALPDELTPERTAGREGFIHVHRLHGDVAHAELRMILRDFDDAALDRHEALVRETVEAVLAAEPQARAEVAVHQQYRNMRAFIERHPAVVAAAERAMREEGIEPVRAPIRGGTDGSLLSERGLPTPNLFTGGHDWHSVREWASLQEMAAASATVVRLAGAWAVGSEP